MKLIGILATSRPALGGTYQYTLSMIDALKQIPQYEYTIYTTAENRSFDHVGLPIVRLPGALRTVGAYIGSKLLRLSRFDRFSGVEAIISPIYSTRLLGTTRPFVFTLHDLQERYLPENFSLAQRAWRNLANSALARRARFIICESNHVKGDIQRFLSVEESRIAVIPAPPVSSLTPPLKSAAGDASHAGRIAFPDKFIFYPAQFFKHKNHARLIDAFACVLRNHPDCRLVLTGQPKYEFANINAQIEKLGIRERVIHLGYVETDVIALAYVRATLVVVPTLFESVSIPVYEAFIMGAPVCAANVTALPDQIGDAGVLFDPYSVDDIARKINLMLSDESLREKLVVRGRERIGLLTGTWYRDQLAALLARLA